MSHTPLQGIGFPVGVDGRAARDHALYGRTCRKPELAARLRRNMAIHEARACSWKSRSAATRLLAMGIAGRRTASRRDAERRHHPMSIKSGAWSRRRRRGLPLHVILRFRLEQDFIAGRLRSPACRYGRKMRLSRLWAIDAGRRTNADVHWPGSTFGYSRPIRWALRWRNGGRRSNVNSVDRRCDRQGKFDAVNEWRRERSVARLAARLNCSSAPPARSSTPPISPRILGSATGPEPCPGGSVSCTGVPVAASAEFFA